MTLLHESDARLLARARQGDDEALEAILQRYHDPLLRYCRRLVPRGRAEDVLQQALLNACVGIRGSAPKGALRPWLYRLTRNAAMDVLRKLQAAPDAELDEGADHNTESLEEAFERRERVRTLLRGISGLPLRQRRAVLMRVQGHGHDEIAAHLDVSGDAARQLLRRGRARLREVAVVFGPIGLVRAALDTATASVQCLGGGALAKVGAGLAAASVLAVAGAGQVSAPQHHAAAGAVPAVIASGAVLSRPTRQATAPPQHADVARANAAARPGLRVETRLQSPRTAGLSVRKSQRHEQVAKVGTRTWRALARPEVRPQDAHPVATQPSPGSPTAVAVVVDSAANVPAPELTAPARSDEPRDADDDATPPTGDDDAEPRGPAPHEVDDRDDADTDDD